MQIGTYLAQYTGISASELFAPDNPLVSVSLNSAGVYSFPVWKVSTVAPPSSADVAAALSGGPAISELQAALIYAASSACAQITSQIVPDATHQNGYTLAAAMVGPGAVVPTSGPAAASFAAMASAFGFQPQAFASLVVAVAAAAQSLSAALATLETGAATATTAAQLATDLSAFESALSSLVANLNGAGLSITVTAPPAITIPGINA